LRQLQSYETILSRYAAQRADHLSQAAELERDLRFAEHRYDTTDFGDDADGRNDLAREIRQMREQREMHLEEVARFDVKARSQISQIRETVSSVMNVDQSLVSRIRNLFREQGITIASILTAVGFIISTIILALTGRTPNKTTPSVNQSKGGQTTAAVAGSSTRGQGRLEGDPRAAHYIPVPTTLYEEPELAVGGYGGAVNWLHIQLERLSNWLAGIIDKLSKSKCPLAARLAWLLKQVKRLSSWPAGNTYDQLKPSDM
jgi:hypothetical protein